jgi:hypothetical protein
VRKRRDKAEGPRVEEGAKPLSVRTKKPKKESRDRGKENGFSTCTCQLVEVKTGRVGAVATEGAQQQRRNRMEKK